MPFLNRSSRPPHSSAARHPRSCHFASRARVLAAATLGAVVVLAGCSARVADDDAQHPITVQTHAEPGAAAGSSPAGGAVSAGSAGSAASLDARTSASSTAGETAQASGRGNDPAGGMSADGCIEDFDPSVDYFPDKATPRYAKNFTVAYHRSYAVLTVSEPSQGAPPAEYVLIRCGAPEPELTGTLAAAQRLTVPVHSLFSGSTTQLPSLVMLHRLEVLTGVASKAYITEPEVIRRVAAPGVVEYADAAGTIDAERVVAAKPDVVITGGADDPAYTTIQRAGIPVLADADWLETDPLGRAEWIKFFGVLTDRDAVAAAAFDRVADAYHETAALVAGLAKVRVVTGQPYQGTWYVPGGGSYTARLISDAGGTYPWAADRSTGSIATDTETVFAKSATAPVWLASTSWTTKAQALAENSALAKFAAFRSGNVWNAVKDTTAGGGNGFYERGAARPDLILADLVAILHPDRLPGHAFTFYLKLA